ncbi:MAG: hypothetical protein GY753_01130, partial [Gammaproteobacteria bacterium]|nr:hypothetical protein [Gammaproteobacteria bacterium]
LENYFNDHQNPLPVITGNSIYDNTSNYRTEYYANAANTVLNATGNWWGNADPGVIAAKIYDYSDSSFSPVVDFVGYLDGEGGTSSEGDAGIGGSMGDATVLVSGKTYLALHPLTVPVGETLTIPAGVRLVFWSSNHGLTVDGTLDIQGTVDSPVTFTGANAVPAAGDWAGITVNSGGSLNMTHGQLLYAKTAINATTPGAFSVTDSVIRDYSVTGIALSGTATGALTNNLIQSSGYSATGLHIDTASLAVTGNRVHGNLYGAYITGASSPVLTGNLFSDNRHGIYLAGSGSDATNPTPVLNSNDIYANQDSQLTVHNYGAGTAITIDATGNWWGTDTPAVGTEIIITDGASASGVDASGALSAPQHTALSAALSITNQYFSPNGDGRQETANISATLTQSTAWTLGVYGKSGLAYRKTGGGATVSETWNGTNNSSQPQPDGYYTVKLFAGNTQNGDLIASTWLRLDNTAPVGQIT